MDPSIVEYIRANSEKYTKEAIRNQLLAAGHDPADIDAALAEWRDAQAEQAAQAQQGTTVQGQGILSKAADVLSGKANLYSPGP